jgi:hypothetical protein
MTNLDELEPLLRERRQTHGDFNETATLAQELKWLCRCDRLSPTQAEALDNICVKLARIVCGDPNHIDSWRDIGGYVWLIVKELEQ